MKISCIGNLIVGEANVVTREQVCVLTFIQNSS